jgi:branched-chain amino acid transport system substrate-binding protein
MKLTARLLAAALALFLFSTAALFCSAGWAAEPIKIGFSMPMTGGLSGTGKAALLGTQIWAEDVNANGGLLGRPVQLIFYDDQSNGGTVPGIYTKLIEVDKVDLLFSSYATNMVAPAMPIAIQKGFVFIGLFGLAVNDQFKYDRYFAIVPSGDNPRLLYSQGFYEVALATTPKPQTVAIVGADAEYAQIATDGARENAQKLGLKIVYDKRYPPSTVDFIPIVRAIQATSPDIVYIASYPPDSAGLIRAANEIGLKPKVFGGGMIGLQYAALKQQLGALLNGVICWDVYVPEPTMTYAGAKEFLARYQARAAAEGVDPLGYYTPPFAYARMQVMAQAVEATKSVDQKVLAEYIHKTTFNTIAGEMRFGPTGEQPVPRFLFVQYQGIEGNDINQFKQPGRQVIVYPPALKSGEFKFPYSEIKR